MRRCAKAARRSCADADGLGTRAALRRALQGHGAARHDVRGDGLQLHRPHRRARPRRARDDADQPARRSRARSSCTSSRARARATRRPRPTRSSGTAPARSIPTAARSTRKRPRGPSYSQVFGQWLCDVAQRDPRIVGDHARDARRLGPGRVSRSAFRTATSTSRSPSSTR